MPLRLQKLRADHGWFARWKMRAMPYLVGFAPNDFLRAALYRPALFGRAYSRWLGAIYSRSPHWTHGERELFAIATSRLNRCRF